METKLDMIPEAQAEIEIRNAKMPNKAMFKLEERIRKEILRLRNAGESADAYEIQDMIRNFAEHFNFRKIGVDYMTLTADCDGHSLLVYEANLDKFYCLIYVRAL